MPTESPRPGETGVSRFFYAKPLPPRSVGQAPLLEELARVEHQLEALAEYRKQLREKIERKEAEDAG